ncbi:MAG TPA: type VII secretion protein EccCb [Nocardioides sp.]
MTTLQVSERRAETDELVLRPPPRLQPSEGASGVLLNAVPMLGSLGAVVLLTTSGGTDRTRIWLTAGLFLAATVGFVLVQVDRQRRQRQQQVGGSRQSYLAYLAGIRTSLREASDRERRALLARHPAPADLPAVLDTRTGWPDAGPLTVRYGVAPGPSSVPLVVPEEVPGEPVDPVSQRALDRLVRAQASRPGLPATLDLEARPVIELPGARARPRARALVGSAAAAHAPERLAVAVLTDDPAAWEWVKWLPHAASPRTGDVVGPARMVTSSAETLAPLLPDHPGPHLLLVVDTRAHPDLPEQPGVTTVRVCPSGPADATVEVEVDECDAATAEAVARRLSSWRSSGRRTGPTVDVLELLSLDEPSRLDPARAWRQRSPGDRLRVPIGVAADGRPLSLDLKESAEHGTGPHGLVVGATGSGKSELLRTLVLGLAVTHSPDELNLVLADFKGGATFAGMAPLPHVSAVITNLADELALVDRMQDALTGELVRRQELLRAAGNHASRRDYEQARAAGADLAPLPALLVVVDEFSELLAAKPELLDLFVAIGRLGRSLGIHLLLASQRLEEGRLRGLESHLSYRIGLRTFSAAESRAVLGVPDAHELPAVPGAGYLRTDASTLVRFTAGYVSGPAGCAVHRPGAANRVLPFTAAPVDHDEPPPAAAARAPSDTRSTLDVALARLVGHGTPAHRVWLPPLDRSDTLDALAPDLAVDSGAGLGSPTWRARGGLVVPIGAVDLPRQQRRDPLVVDLSGAAGHVAVVGSPRSGKSTLLRTLVGALSLAATPLESQFYVLDLGGGAFAAMADLPHVAGVAARSQPDVVRRTVAEVAGIVDRREAWFREQGLDSVDDYRARRARGETDDGWGDVFLVVDGWSTLRSDFEGLEQDVQQIALRGLAVGVHLVASATRWADFRTTVHDLFGTRLELRLGDPLDSEADRRAAALVPTDRPGRGLLPDGSHVLVALPRIDGDPDPTTTGDGIDNLVRRVAAGWHGPAAPRLRLLPTRVGLDEVTGRTDSGPLDATPGRLVLGIDERRLAPVSLDPSTDPHLLVLGEGGSGKTATLRTYLREVMRTRGPDRAQVVVVDYRRSLLGEVPDEHLLHYLPSAGQATPALTELAAYLETRLPGPAATPEQLRARSWWTGPEVFVVVDDYDLVATGQGSPVAALAPLMAQARDVGLHVVVARRSGGAARAQFEPVLQAMRDLAQPGLMLPGNPDDGPLLGPERPAPGPPGRARLVTRDAGVQPMQVAWSEPAG